MMKTNLKPFDLEACMRGEKVVTRDGREFEFGGYNPDADRDVVLVGWVEKDLVAYYDSGNIKIDSESKYDLFMAPKTKKYFRRLYKTHNFVTPQYCVTNMTAYFTAISDVEWLSDWEEFEVEE